MREVSQFVLTLSTLLGVFVGLATVGEFGVFQDPIFSWQNENGKQKSMRFKGLLRWFFIHISHLKIDKFSLHSKNPRNILRWQKPQLLSWLDFNIFPEIPCSTGGNQTYGPDGDEKQWCRGLHRCCLGGIASEDLTRTVRDRSGPFSVVLLYTCGFLGYKVKIAGGKIQHFDDIYTGKHGEFSWVHELLVSGRVWELRWR